MQKFEVTKNDDGLNVGVVLSNYVDLYLLTLEEASEFVKCIDHVLNGSDCTHDLVHRIEHESGNLYNLLLAVSSRHIKIYTVNKRKLIELKIELMGALDG